MTEINNRDVLLDMDGVLADFEAGIEAHAYSRYGLDLRASREAYIQDVFPEYARVIQTLPEQAGFFRDLPVVPNALRGVQRIVDAGFTPRICSALFTTSPTCAPEKRAWLGQYLVPLFGEHIVANAIFTDAKADFEGIALIDDKARIRNAANAGWQHIIFRRPYNRFVETSWAIEDWTDMNLEKLLDRATFNRRKT